jgi:hypothetical protein
MTTPAEGTLALLMAASFFDATEHAVSGEVYGVGYWAYNFPDVEFNTHLSPSALPRVELTAANDPYEQDWNRSARLTASVHEDGTPRLTLHKDAWDREAGTASVEDYVVLHTGPASVVEWLDKIRNGVDNLLAWYLDT